MDSSIVVKVKYGEILRRFNARVNEAGQLDLDIDGLRNKVIGLFNFFLDADLTLTYIDEDGDIVALVDDEDLYDVVRQSLNPLRITVKLKAEKGGKFHARSRGNSAPMRSTRVQCPLPNLNGKVSEYLLSVPKPLRETLSKIVVDLASKAASSSSVPVELVDFFSKMGLSQVSSVSEFQTRTESSTQSLASGSIMDASMTNKETEASRDVGPTLEVFPTASVEEPVPKPIQKVDRVNRTRRVGSLKLYDDLPADSSPASSDNGVGYREECFKNYVDLFLSYNDNDVKKSGDVFHRGAQCDVCGVHPIAGPVFKSKVRENYDMCSVCFSQIGIEADHIRIDPPWAHHSMLTEVKRGFETQPRQLKLDSFSVDVDFMDATRIAPSTPFTKIWRFRNNGTTVWPLGTQLVWIGGDKLRVSLSIDLQISSGGIPMENELVVAADFTSPDLPGRYISYWRMAAPSGEKFGQHVWVLIQVDASMEVSLGSLNLNLPPQDSDDLTDPEILNSNTVPSESGTSVLFPITQIASAVPSGTRVSSPPTVVAETVQETIISNEVEESLLKDLEEMGFNQTDLNKEVLRLNDYNLEQSLDDLCGIAEWDPILKELQEMGFCDKEMNRKLLLKNNGSIKRVVMDLITGDEV